MINKFYNVFFAQRAFVASTKPLFYAVGVESVHVRADAILLLNTARKANNFCQLFELHKANRALFVLRSVAKLQGQSGLVLDDFEFKRAKRIVRTTVISKISSLISLKPPQHELVANQEHLKH